MISLLILIILFLGLILSVNVGKAISLWQKRQFPNEKHKKNRIIEGAIIALLGLLIAFTFSGAHERFEARRTLVIDEANAIETVYLRANVLPNHISTLERKYINQYLDIRISIYKMMPDINKATAALNQSEAMKLLIWNTAEQACMADKNAASCIVILPAINKMIDVANTRVAMTQIHPPIVIIGMLVILALFSAVLLGYGMQHDRLMHSLHVITYLTIIALIIFTIIELEYPRISLISVNYFDNLLMNLHHKLID